MYTKQTVLVHCICASSHRRPFAGVHTWLTTSLSAALSVISSWLWCPLVSLSVVSIAINLNGSFLQDSYARSGSKCWLWSCDYTRGYVVVIYVVGVFSSLMYIYIYIYISVCQCQYLLARAVTVFSCSHTTLLGVHLCITVMVVCYWVRDCACIH